MGHPRPCSSPRGAEDLPNRRGRGGGPCRGEPGCSLCSPWPRPRQYRRVRHWRRAHHPTSPGQRGRGHHELTAYYGKSSPVGKGSRAAGWPSAGGPSLQVSVAHSSCPYATQYCQSSIAWRVGSSTATPSSCAKGAARVRRSQGEPDHPAYGASKAGLNSLGQSMAQALGPHGIYVTTVAPGFVETDMSARCSTTPPVTPYTPRVRSTGRRRPRRSPVWSSSSPPRAPSP